MAQDGKSLQRLIALLTIIHFLWWQQVSGKAHKSQECVCVCVCDFNGKLYSIFVTM